MKKITDFINSLPSNGEWWSESSKRTFATALRLLLDRGFEFEEATALLEGLYRAVAAEYGE